MEPGEIFSIAGLDLELLGTPPPLGKIAQVILQQQPNEGGQMDHTFPLQDFLHSELPQNFIGSFFHGHRKQILD